jgi:hypothetical protein
LFSFQSSKKQQGVMEMNIKFVQADISENIQSMDRCRDLIVKYPSAPDLKGILKLLQDRERALLLNLSNLAI